MENVLENNRKCLNSLEEQFSTPYILKYWKCDQGSETSLNTVFAITNFRIAGYLTESWYWELEDKEGPWAAYRDAMYEQGWEGTFSQIK